MVGSIEPTARGFFEACEAGKGWEYLAGHSNAKTTQIYDRRRRRVSRIIVERISI